MGHLSLRSANPTLSSGAFQTAVGSGSEQMTIHGTVNKTAFSLLLLFMTATMTWQNPQPFWMIGGAIAGFIIALITVFKKMWSPWTVPLYCLCEGAFLGGVSRAFEASYSGIVSQAIFLTFGVLAMLLFAYRSGLIKVSDKFRLGVVAATGGIALVYFLSFILGFFGVSMPFMHGSSWFSIGFSLFVVVIASLNLVLDFDFIEEGAERGAPKYMEWYGAFGLMVTLIWLYLEILRLLAKLQGRRR